MIPLDENTVKNPQTSPNLQQDDYDDGEDVHANNTENKGLRRRKTPKFDENKTLEKPPPTPPTTSSKPSTVTTVTPNESSEPSNAPVPERIRMMKTFWNTCCLECGAKPDKRPLYNRLQVAQETNQVPSAIANFMSSTVQMLLQEYKDACRMYGCGDRINAGVLTALRFSLPAIRPEGSFHDADALALTEILLKHCNTDLSHVRRLDFSVSSKRGKLNGRKGFTSNGAYALSTVLRQSRHIEEVFLQRNCIGPFGAVSIFKAAAVNSTLKCLLMRRCTIMEKGAMVFAKECLGSEVCGLQEVDLSVNSIGFRGSMAVEQAISDREINSWSQIDVDMEGNMIFQEVMNCVTHGLGVILGIIGSISLLTRVKHKSINHIACCTLYSLSILTLYLSSTLFHSFFAFTTTRYVFAILDHCAIYILIAGSYTPFLGITLADKPLWSVYLLAFIWLCCICGVCVEAFASDWIHRKKFSLAMYLGLGWSCMVCAPDLLSVLPSEAMVLLILGGVGYTAGVPFFVRDNNLDHSIWHCFVLAGSVFHWFGVFSYVVFLGDP